jgi:hypothetical protein
MLILLYRDRITSALWDLHGNDLFCMHATRRRCRRSSLRLKGECILIFARNVPLRRNALRRLAERDRWESCVKAWIHKSPSDRGVHQFAGAALVPTLWLQRDEWRAAHALHATSNQHISIAYGDRLCCARHRLKSRAAESIHRLASNLNWESRNQESHSRNVAVVFTRLVRAPENDVVNDRRVNSTSRNDCLKDGGGEVVRAHSCERAAVTTDGGANRLNDPRLAEWSSRRY